MMDKKKKGITIITVGFALFAMFFGAGNLILPPYIGMLSGEEWLFSLLGFFTTAIFAPFLGVLLVAKYGNSFMDLGKRLSPKFINLLTFLIILCVGPLIAVPRTGATTFEVGFLPFFPELSPIIFAVLFFGLVLFLSISKSKIVDIIGQFLTPVLLLCLAILVVLGIVNPPQEPIVSSMSSAEAFSFSFIEGYQTLDVLASVVFAGIVIGAVIDSGYTEEKEKTKITIYAGMVSTLALLFIYGGLIYLGATTDYPNASGGSRTELLLYISRSILGDVGALVISVAISLACLTTAIALTSATGDFVNKITNTKIPYSVGVMLCVAIAGILSVNSVDEIIKYAINILLFVYPIVFTLILLMLLFGKKVVAKTPYMCGILVSSILSLVSVAENLGLKIETLSKMKKAIPLSEYGLEWLLPSFLAFGISCLFAKRS